MTFPDENALEFTDVDKFPSIMIFTGDLPSANRTVNSEAADESDVPFHNSHDFDEVYYSGRECCD